MSWDWQLESTVVYRGAQYLDNYLGVHAVPALGKFQMLAISCLRTALKHSNKLAERERQRLPCKHWAEVTDGACTEAEVRNTCLKLERMLHQEQRTHPNAKQRLRFLWYRMFDAGTVKQEHVYIYMLASFLLHLSLLEPRLSASTPTKLAMAALSLSLKVFGFPPMPPVLAQHCFYLAEELQEVQEQLGRAQVRICMSCCQQCQRLCAGAEVCCYVMCCAHGQPYVALAYQRMQPAAGRSCCALSSHCVPTDVFCVQEEVLGPQLRALWVTSYSYAGPTAAQQPAYNLLRKIVADCCKLSYLPPVEASGGSKQQAAPQPTATEAADAVAAEPAAVVAPAAAPAPAAAAAEGAPTAAVEATDQAAPATGNRVLTRAAAAAGLASCQRQQQQQFAPTGAHAVPVGTPAGELGQHSRTAPDSSHASSSRATSLAAANSGAENNAPLATPQRPAAASTGQAVPPMGPLPDFAALTAAATPPAAIASAASAGHVEAHNSQQQPPSTGGGSTSARRCPTRELPPRRAVAVSRYGMLASRGNGCTPARGALPAADAPSSSRAGSHTGMPAGHPPTGFGSSSGLYLTLPGAAGAGPSGLNADGAGPSSLRAGVLLGTAGSMTPASPKHAAAGTRGLAALFAEVRHGGAGSSQAGTGSNTGRLLSGLPSLQSKFNLADSADLQRLSEEPAWLWSIQQHDAGLYGSGSKAGPSSSNGPGPHVSSVPVLRSARRAAAAAAGSSGPSQYDILHKVHDRQGVHTRSSSGGGNCDWDSSHWHSVPSGAARTSHHPSHD